MNPDFQSAATKATQTLIDYDINSSPVSPFDILQQIESVLMISYEDILNNSGLDHRCLIDSLGEKNQDAFTTVNIHNGKPQYIVTYNQRLPFFLLQRALARELGHIILGHDGSLPEKVRNDEAKCFAHHLLVPRPLIHSLQAAGIRLTVEVLGNLTGCYDYCLSCMRKLPGVSVPADLNRAVRDNFMPYIINFFEYQRFAALKDGSAVADLGTYMDGYEE